MNAQFGSLLLTKSPMVFDDVIDHLMEDIMLRSYPDFHTTGICILNFWYLEVKITLIRQGLSIISPIYHILSRHFFQDGLEQNSQNNVKAF